MDLTEKIKLIQSRTNLTSSLFADEIGIQRSSMSHILAGRNKPSLDIVQKIVRRFPEFGLDWIMDEGLQNDTAKAPSATSRVSDLKPAVQETVPEEAVFKTNQEKPQPIDHNKPIESVDPEKIIDRVMIFYTDGTFRDFKKSS